MKRLLFTLFVLAVVTTQPVAQTQTTQRSIDRTAAIRSMLDAYCIGCHSATARAGGVAFAGMSLDDIGSNAEVWEKAVRKLRGRLMPPPGSRQPDQAQVDAFIAALEDALDKEANVAGHPVAGRVPIQRMTRTEYACLLYTSPSPRDRQKSRMPSSA